MGVLKEKKYTVIKNFITSEEAKLFTRYCRIKHRSNLTNFDCLQNNNYDTYFYGDPMMEALMIEKIHIMQDVSKLQLLPTYAFWRMYSLNADLKKHTDRPACQVSVTVMFGSDGTPWPIYMDGTAVHLDVGDAAIYFGCEVEHWREEFKGDWHAQAFLHYVDANGPYKEWYKDARDLFGTGLEERKK